MTVKVKLKKLRLALWLPTFAAGRIALSCATRELKKKGYTLKKSHKLKRDVMRAVKSAKKRLGNFVLADVSSHDGLKVVIKV